VRFLIAFDIVKCFYFVHPFLPRWNIIFFLALPFGRTRERQNNTRIPLCLFFIKRDIFADIFRTPAASFFPGLVLGRRLGQKAEKKFKKHFTLSRPWLREKLFTS